MSGVGPDVRPVLGHAPSTPADAFELQHEVVRFGVPESAVWMAFTEPLMMTESCDWDPYPVA